MKRMIKKKLFSFSRQASILKPKVRSVRAEKLKDEKDEPPYYIRGRVADSKDEWWASLALEKIVAETGWSWDYQVAVYGGRTRPGGNVIDFLVHTPGMWTMLDPMGRPFHTGHREDRQQMQEVARRKKYRLIAWFTDETPTRESVYVFLRDKLYV